MAQIALRRIVEGLKSPWSLAFSGFGVTYGLYYIIDTTQAGVKYDPDFDLKGKTFIVTGANSGIGQATALELAKRNAHVIMACRDRQKCIAARRDIVLSTKNKHVYCRTCDLSDFDSIKGFVERLTQGKNAVERIDGVINNAAIMEPKRKVTSNGIETMLATNHMGTFLLNGLLLDKLFAQEHPSRLVFLNTNVINRKCDLDLDDLNAENRVKFNGYDVYKQSKLAQAMFAKELSERIKGSNVTVLLADPGRTSSNLSQQLDSQTFFLSRWLLKPVGFLMGQRKPEKAVKPVLFAVADPEAATLNGVFIDRDRNPQPLGEIVEDKTLRGKLWSTSLVWTKFNEYSAALNNTINDSSVELQNDNLKEKGSSFWGKLWFW
uniref:Uncharacterized protein n=1 Tax=Panagrolaimus superbus TaxID=310955 RepID=A0A914Z6S3_9BILA